MVDATAKSQFVADILAQADGDDRLVGPAEVEGGGYRTGITRGSSNGNLVAYLAEIDLLDIPFDQQPALGGPGRTQIQYGRMIHVQRELTAGGVELMGTHVALAGIGETKLQLLAGLVETAQGETESELTILWQGECRRAQGQALGIDIQAGAQ